MRRSATIAVIAFLALIVVTRSAQAGRVVQFEILVDGKVVLHAYRLDQGEGFDIAWNHLKTQPVQNPAERFVLSAEETARLKAFQPEIDKDDPKKAVIKGNCRIFCRYAGDISVKEIRLVRKDEKAPWFIDPKQVDEMAKVRTIDKAMRTREQVDAAAKEK